MSDSEETQSQTSNQEPKLTINDLNLMANIINVCSKRGAFNANELKVTGELFEKLSLFLQAVKQSSESKLDTVNEGGEGEGTTNNEE